MPFVYGVVPAVNFATSGTPNTEVDPLFIAPGARTLHVIAAQVQGKGAGLTALSGIMQRIKRYTTSASSGGAAVTPSPRDPGQQAATATAGQASAGVTPGTGGPIYQLAFGCAATGPGAWSWLNNGDSAIAAQGSANTSIDFFNISGTASLNFELSVDIQE